MLEIPAEKIVWKKVESETVVLDTETGIYYVLDELSSFIWERILLRKSTNQIAHDVVSHYEIDLAQAITDVDQFLDQSLKEGILCSNENSDTQEENLKPNGNIGNGSSKKPYTVPTIKKFDDILQWGFGS